MLKKKVINWFRKLEYLDEFDYHPLLEYLLYFNWIVLIFIRWTLLSITSNGQTMISLRNPAALSLFLARKYDWLLAVMCFRYHFRHIWDGNLGQNNKWYKTNIERQIGIHFFFQIVCKLNHHIVNIQIRIYVQLLNFPSCIHLRTC